MKMPAVNYDVITVNGGWDTQTPTLALPSGVVRDCSNFEIATTGGASRVGGYERFDGRVKPSDALYTIVQVASFTNTPTTGQTLSGTSGGAHGGVVIAVGTNYVAVTKKTGTLTFVVGETVTVGATTIGVVVATTVSISIALDAQYLNLAADQYRADILVVPGSGSVLGVTMFNDIVYAFRANAGATAVDMYKSSSSGWAQVAFEHELSFSNANTSVGDGDTLTQGAVTATIRRVLVQTGTLASGVNTGRLVISAPSGGNFAAGAATSTGGGTLTLSAVQTAITMAIGANQKFEFDKGNFFAQASGVRLYGCDNVNRCFEFDGTYFIPIATGTTPDAPRHIVIFKNHLHAQISSSSLNSGINTPYNWSSTAGGGEKGLGDTLSGYKVVTGSTSTGSLMIGGKNNIFMLYGTSASDWNYVTYAPNVGIIDYTAQSLGDTYFYGSQGVVSLQASQVFGNFEQAALTNNIKTFITQKRTLVAYSSLSRERSQYRLFFTDGYALYLTIVNGKFLGAMQMQFADAFNCASNGELTSGEEVLYVGGKNNGYVYQLDKGTSFDGASIDARLVFNFNTAKSPRTLKRWRKASVEMQGTAYAEIQFGYTLGYGSTHEIQPSATTHTSSFSGSNWDSFTWDAFYWDGQTLSPTEVDMVGTGENVQITITSTYDYLKPFNINSFILHYSARRGMR